MDDIEKVKQKIDIVDFINAYIPLKKIGRNFKTNCPFHLEKTASFVVSPERQIWHCFGCGKGGDAISFFMEYEKVDFAESLKYLADKVGIKLSGPIQKTDRERKKELIYEINHISSTFYSYLLLNHKVGKKALDYLENTRKMPLELIKKFNLGYAPNKENLLSSYLIDKKGYKEEDLINAGLANKRYGKMFDFFKHRLIFPIHDTRDNIIAFSARSLNNDTQTGGPKYINTKETMVYRKGDTLFGLNLAKEEIKKENRVIVVEGEFDVISPFKEGIKNIVAVKGTALTEGQIKVLKRYAEKISFCFDTDAAGIEAQKRSISMIEKEGVLASVIVPPLGKDPDELIRENPLLFKKAVKNDINIYDFIIDTTTIQFNKNEADGKRKILEKTIPYLLFIENEVIKEHYFKKLALLLDSSVESLMKQADKMKSSKQSTFSNPVKKQQIPREELLESYLLSLILQSKNPKITFFQVNKILDGISLSIHIYNRLFNKIREFIENSNNFTVNEFTSFLPGELLESFDKCYLAPISFVEDEKYTLEVEKIANDVKTLSIKNKLKELAETIKVSENSGDEKETEKLRLEFNRLTILLKQKTL